MDGSVPGGIHAVIVFLRVRARALRVKSIVVHGSGSSWGSLLRNPQGAFYRKYLARFSDDDARALTVTLYLYADWPFDAVGETFLYLNEKCEPDVDVRPEGGKHWRCFCLNAAGMNCFSLVRGVWPSLVGLATSCR